MAATRGSSKIGRKPAKRARIRRSPEEARALLLGAAERIFKTHLADAVGLKEVAREAGVSHALISHYFGTYDALVEATLERRVQQLRIELVEIATSSFAKKGRAVDLIAAYRAAIARLAKDPLTLRLAVWALLSGRANAADFFPGQPQGMKALAELITARAVPKVRRKDVELALIASFAMTVTWVFGRGALVNAMGRKPSAEDDAWFDAESRKLIERYLHA